MNIPFVNPPAQSTVNVREIVSPRGVRFWLVEDYAVPLVSLEFAFGGGAAQDPAGKAGAATLLAGLLDEGAGDLDSQAFQQALDEKAIEISFHGERDHIGGRMRTLARHLDRAGELLRLAVNAPRLDETPFERVREQMNAQLRHEANDPSAMAGRAWRARVFPGHAYGLPTNGTHESLAANRARRTERARPSADHPRRPPYRRRRRDRRGARGASSSTRRSPICRRAANSRAVAEAPFAGLGGIEVVDLDVPQSTIRFGRPALMREDPDYIASIVLAHVLGGGTGLSSRLFREVREKRGLAYSVSASISSFDHASYLYGGTTTKNERADESLAVIAAQILDMAHGGLERRRIGEGQEIPRRLLSLALRHLGQDRRPARPHPARRPRRRPGSSSATLRVAAVTMADARRTAERVFGDGALSVVVVGRPAKV